MNLLERLETETVLADGAMGSLLIANGVAPDSCLEALCIDDPDRIAAIHTAYADAGVTIIRTHSFGANAARLDRHGLAGHVNEINWQAAQIARQATKGRGVTIAGSVGPIGIPGLSRDEIAALFREQLGALLDGGAQMIFLETFQSIDELLIALEVKYSLHHCPAVCSLACGPDGRLPDGLHVSDAFIRLAKNDAEIAGLNCVNGPQAAIEILRTGLPDTLPLAVLPNAGLPRMEDGRAVYDLTPDAFAEAALELRELGARIIGGCCGTTPAHIAAAAARLFPA
ncbi:MAG: homocysteine S-methyltransferase family protein [Terrimicrobiaceae bacterium]|nr:homocysteine S-methyltransferase family protein [Terrimicrobiaceae bacterium]